MKTLPRPEDLVIQSLGPATHPSRIARTGPFVADDSRVLLVNDARQAEELLASGQPLPSAERAGPRGKLYFEPSQTVCGIVTCGGLCPGLNDVLRSLTLNLLGLYGVKRVLGFRYGYKGLTRKGPAPVDLTRDLVQALKGTAGTFLGSSRGPQDLTEMVDTLLDHQVNILFVLGGDGTLRGGSAIAAECRRRGCGISVIGVPKTIDNDIAWTNMSFGFHTAVDEARKVILAAHAEARSAEDGIGLVKLMGRHSGFIAAHATRASAVTNFCLIPEVQLDMPEFLESLASRLSGAGHAVVVVAEGAGQDLLELPVGTDASGNKRLQDIGLFLKDRITERFPQATLKYIDPSYAIRSAPPNTLDSEYCLLLGHFASHAGMAGKTDMTVGWWNQQMVHLPISLVTASRKQVDVTDELWQSVRMMTEASNRG